MIVDASAVIAILRGEPEAGGFAAALASSSFNRMSAATYVEIGAVLDRAADPVISRQLDEWIEAARITIEPVTAQQARIARAAFRDFGRGSGHPAGLNVGDCFAYALAKERDEPLLFKGDDFARTDIPFVGDRRARHRLAELVATYGAT